MPDSKPQRPPAAPSTTDRRVGPRYPVRPTEYIEIGENNGGLILDISEGGMAVAAAQALVGNQILRFRFQLPRLPETIEASGEINWIGETKKRAGVRFVDLSPDGHALIQKWIALQNSYGSIADPLAVPADAPALSTPSTKTQHQQAQLKLSSTNGDISLKTNVHSPSPLTDEPEADDPENYPPIYETQSATPAKNPAPERRTQNRRPMTASTYVQLDDGNGGLIADLSESGFSFRAAKVLEHDQLFVRFQLPGSTAFIETPAWVIWKSASQKKAGARFGALPEDAKKQITEWLASQTSAVDLNQQKSSSAPKVASPIPLLAPDSVPIPSYISPTPRKSVPSVPSSLSQPVSASPSKSKITLPAASSIAPPVPPLATQVATSATPNFTKPAAPVSSLAPAIVLPVVPPFIPPKSSLPVAPLLASSSASAILNPIIPAADRGEPSWYIAPKKSLSFWQIAALLLLIGGLSAFGIRFYTNRQSVTTPPPPSAAPTSIASTAPQENQPLTSEPAPIADESTAKSSSSAPPATAPASDSRTPATRDANPENPDAKFVDEPHEFVDQPRTKPSQPPQIATPVTRSDTSVTSQPAPTPNQAADTSASRSRSATGSFPPPANAATYSATQKDSPSPNVNTPPVSDSTTHRSQDTQPAATSASRPQDSPPVDRASSNPSTTTPTPSAAVSNPAPLEIPIGSVSILSRFRAIRTPADSSSPNRSSNSGGVLQMGALQSSPIPAYPPEALRQRVQGLVELDVSVGSDGSVQSVHLVKGPAELATAAMTAVRAWRYSQTILGGRPVETEQSVYLTFKLGK